MRTVHRSIFLCTLAALLGLTSSASATPGGGASARERVERLCGGISGAERARPLFGDRLAVVSSRALRAGGGRPLEPRALGAEVLVRAEPGLTARYVHRMAACQVALYSASLATSGDDPLAVEGAEVQVRESGPGFVIRISADRRSAAREIVDRAMALGRVPGA